STVVAPASTGSVTEAAAIRLFLEQSPQARRVPLVLESVDAALRVQTRVSNPEVAYQVEDAAGVRDEFLTFQQELPITGRRGLLNERAEVAASAAGLAAESDLYDEVFALKRSFHEVLYRERVLKRLRGGAELLAQTIQILEEREREGEGSGYDVLRAEQELAELRMTNADADTALAAARSRFGSFYDPDSNMGSARLEGGFTPSGPVPEIDQAILQALEQRLDLRSLSMERERLDLERRAARRRRFPEPVVTAGWKRVEAIGLSDTGFIAALTIPLPIFDRGRFEAVRATAEGERVELETEITTRRIRSEVQAAVAREQAARDAARRYGEDVERRAGKLQRIARLKYDEGESGILELLDAQRTSLTMQLRALATRYEAKIAEIERDRVIGNEVKP
ncbi:MAG: TolC family protein, partial [Phycisphaerae bacterium]|nr:TolC family protein [Phycisphaerae bacterium]